MVTNGQIKEGGDKFRSLETDPTEGALHWDGCAEKNVAGPKKPKLFDIMNRNFTNNPL